MSERRKAFLDHNGVRIFHVWKGTRALTYLYALEPGINAETSEEPYFDVRQLPAPYIENLIVEDAKAAIDDDDFKVRYENEQEAHREAIRRAIDDGFDFAKGSLGRKVKGIFSTIFNR